MAFYINLVDRRGANVKLSLDKIAQRIEDIAVLMKLQKTINYMELLTHVINNLKDGMSTSEIDDVIVNESISKNIENENYYILGSAVAVSNLQKNVFARRKFPVMSKEYGYGDVLLDMMTPKRIAKAYGARHDSLEKWHDYEKRRMQKHSNVIKNNESTIVQYIDEKWHDFVTTHRERINEAVNYSRDFKLDYFGLKTLIKGYIIKEADSIPLETPAEVYFREAIQCYWSLGIDEVIRAYELLSSHAYTHATPTMSNSMTKCGQLASCFLLDHVDDSIDGMYGADGKPLGTIPKMAQISKNSGGIGLAIHDIRSNGQKVRTTNGKTSGIPPYARVMNVLSRQIDQGGKRPGAIAVYLSPIHPDFCSVIQMKQQKGKEIDQATNLFYGCWIPDEFMRRVQKSYSSDISDAEKNEIMWSTFDYDEHPLLYKLSGAEFTEEYLYLEAMGLYKTRVPISEVWHVITRTLRMTSMPYILFSDACNNKSNQKNLGYIKCSNLCAEIVEYSSPDETAVCNLASISLPWFLVYHPDGKVSYDYAKLHEVAMFAAQGLDLVIDENNYPTNCTKKSNNLHRPIGLGVQGLVDVYMAMGYPFESAEAFSLNCAIHETIYHAAMTMSIARAKSHGAYSSFQGSPLSQGKFQFDLWESDTKFSGMYDWNALREEVTMYGARNSLLVALMPTASTSQIMGNTESFECINGNIARRETGSGQFLIFNKYLRKVLRKYGRDNEETANEIILNDGSVKTLSFLTQHEKDIFKTAYEIKQRAVIDQSADRGHFVCQSQSMNLFLAKPDQDVVTTMLLYGWSKGLKTGSYYIRSKNASEENKALGMSTITAVPAAPPRIAVPIPTRHNSVASTARTNNDSDDDIDGPVCTMKDGCVSCGS